MDAQAIASAGVPVLCIDTCSILDVMRDPTRETAKPHDRQAAIDLVAAAESSRLICLMAEQVAIEFVDHDQPVQDVGSPSSARSRPALWLSPKRLCGPTLVSLRRDAAKSPPKIAWSMKPTLRPCRPCAPQG